MLQASRPGLPLEWTILESHETSLTGFTVWRVTPDLVSYLQKVLYIFLGLSWNALVSENIFCSNWPVFLLYFKVSLQGSKYHCPQQEVNYKSRKQGELLNFGDFSVSETTIRVREYKSLSLQFPDGTKQNKIPNDSGLLILKQLYQRKWVLSSARSRKTILFNSWTYTFLFMGNEGLYFWGDREDMEVKIGQVTPLRSVLRVSLFQRYTWADVQQSGTPNGFLHW